MRNPDVMSTPERDRRFGEAAVTVKFYKGNMANVERLTVEQAEALRKSLTDFIDGAPEPEWEYSVGFNDPEEGWINDHADIHDNYEDARSDYSEPNWLVEDRVVRRRKAGPWLPVEGENGD